MRLYAWGGERLVHFPTTCPTNELRQGDAVFASCRLDRQRKRLFNSRELNLLTICWYRMSEALSLRQHHPELRPCFWQIGRGFGPYVDLFTIRGDGKAGLQHDLVSRAANLWTH